MKRTEFIPRAQNPGVAERVTGDQENVIVISLKHAQDCLWIGYEKGPCLGYIDDPRSLRAIARRIREAHGD